MSSGLYLGTLPSRKWMGYCTASAAASLWFELQELSEIQGYKYTHSHTHKCASTHSHACILHFILLLRYLFIDFLDHIFRP